MSEDIESIRRKIKALLAKADDTAATEAEAQAFNAKAHELMLKYNIARAEIEEKESGPVVRIKRTLKVQRRPWSESILQGITKLYYCKWYSMKDGRSHIITIYGEEQNVLVAHAIAVMVLRSVQSEARAHGGGRSFMNGAAHRIWERCREMMAFAKDAQQLEQTRQIGQNKTGNALVVLEQNEEAANDAWLRAQGIRMGKPRKSKGAQAFQSDAYNAGRSHGNKVQLRRNLLT